MKKLSEITESIWSDIQDRSSGDVVRKEDNVDFLEPDDFIAHIRKIYRIDNTPYDIENHTNYSTIFIPICSYGVEMIKMIGIYFDYDKGVVYTHKSIKKNIPKLWAKLDQNFDLYDDDPDYQYYIIINPKDTNREINNSYVLKVLNFIIDNIYDDVDNNTVKPCLFRRTNESIWSDLEDRSSGDVVRKEDDLFNIRELKPVDMGGSVLWADKDLCYSDEYHFGYSEVFELVKNSGWRLPTLKEVEELDEYRVKTYDSTFVIYGPNEDLVFVGRGLVYSDKVKEITDDDFYFAWTSDLCNSHQVHILTFDDDELIHSKIGSTSIMDQVTNDISGKLCVRLVKDK